MPITINDSDTKINVGGKKFKITGKKGFHITFANGWTVSVQFGQYNYCDFYHTTAWNGIELDAEECGSHGSDTAEVAVFDAEGTMVLHPCKDSDEEWDEIGGYMTPEEVLYVMRWTSTQPNGSAGITKCLDMEEDNADNDK